MKLLSIFLSFCLCFNQSVAPASTLSSFQLAFENKLLETVNHWNRAKTYKQAVDRISSLSSDEKKRLHRLLQKEHLSNVKPVQVEFLPAKHKFVIRNSERSTALSQTWWLLATMPTFVLYTGQRLIEVAPKATLSDVLAATDDPAETQSPPRSSPNSTPKIKPKGIPKGHPNGKPSTGLWNILMPKAEAQFFTPEYQTQIDEQRKQKAKEQTDLWQKILIAALLSGGGFMAVGYLWANYSHHIDPSFGIQGKENLRKEKELAKVQFPEIEQVLFANDAPLSHFTCESSDKSSRLTKIIFMEQGKTEVKFDFEDQPVDLETNSKSPTTYTERINKAEDCCQNYPCGKWLDQRLRGETPDFEKTTSEKNSEKGSR